MELSTSSDIWEPSLVLEVLPEACWRISTCSGLRGAFRLSGAPGYSGSGLQSHARPPLEVGSVAMAGWNVSAGSGICSVVAPCSWSWAVLSRSMTRTGELALAESLLCSGVSENGGTLSKLGLRLCWPPISR